MKRKIVLILSFGLSISCKIGDFSNSNKKSINHNFLDLVTRVDNPFEIKDDGFYLIENSELYYNSQYWVRACYWKSNKVILDNYWSLKGDTVYIMGYRSIYSGCKEAYFFADLSKNAETTTILKCKPLDKHLFFGSGVKVTSLLKGENVLASFKSNYYLANSDSAGTINREILFNKHKGILNLKIDVESELNSFFYFGW